MCVWICAYMCFECMYVCVYECVQVCVFGYVHICALSVPMYVFEGVHACMYIQLDFQHRTGLNE